MSPSRVGRVLLGTLVAIGAVRGAAACGSFDGANEGDAGTDGPVLPTEAGAADAASDAAPDVSVAACVGDGFEVDADASSCPELLASGQKSPLHVAVTGTRLYWTSFGSLTDDGRVMVSDLDGSQARVFAQPTGSDSKHPKFIVASGGFVYWGTQAGLSSQVADPEMDQTGAVLRLPADGLGATATFVGPPGSSYTPRGIAVDSSSVYWMSGNSVVVSALAGGPSALFRAQTGIVAGNDLVVDATGVVLVARGNATTNPGFLLGVSIDIDAGYGPKITNRADFPWSLRFSTAGTSLFWTERGAPDAGTGTLNQTSRLGNGVSQLLTGLNHPQFLAVDATHVYVTVQGLGDSDGEIRRVTVDGKAPLLLVSGLAKPHGITLDATHIYWTTPGDGRVWRMKKP